MSASPPRHPKAPPIPRAPGLAVEADEVVYANRFAMQRVRFRYTRFDGSLSGLLTWELWRRGSGVLMLPYDPATDRVALIEQFRLPMPRASAASRPNSRPACWNPARIRRSPASGNCTRKPGWRRSTSRRSGPSC